MWRATAGLQRSERRYSKPLSSQKVSFKVNLPNQATVQHHEQIRSNKRAHQVIDAELLQLQHNRAQIGAQDLWVGLLLQVLPKGRLCVQPEALSWPCAPCTPRPLMRACLRTDTTFSFSS